VTAAYLKSAFQKEVGQKLADIDPQSTAFSDSALLVIDCRDDAAAFRSRLTDAQIATIEQWHARGKLLSVSGLARPGHDYAIDKVRERFELLDENVRSQLRTVLQKWRAERERRGIGNPYESGIEIVLPVNGIRLPYDLSDLQVFS
jgi:hypothetical protein